MHPSTRTIISLVLFMFCSRLLFPFVPSEQTPFTFFNQSYAKSGMYPCCIYCCCRCFCCCCCDVSLSPVPPDGRSSPFPLPSFPSPLLRHYHHRLLLFTFSPNCGYSGFSGGSLFFFFLDTLLFVRCL
ncbi:MAG: hypothetical protein JOS17DRAFT_736201 [Linnemannia elongata]|nr:MAG: hypothetical protein JOS17DRAFT_736201 [Linnemannia elongata]